MRPVLLWLWHWVVLRLQSARYFWVGARVAFIGLGAARMNLIDLHNIAHFAAPEIYGTVSPAYLICFVAELALALWLLVRGVDEAKWRCGRRCSGQQLMPD